MPQPPLQGFDFVARRMRTHCHAGSQLVVAKEIDHPQLGGLALLDFQTPLPILIREGWLFRWASRKGPKRQVLTTLLQLPLPGP